MNDQNFLSVQLDKNPTTNVFESADGAACIRLPTHTKESHSLEKGSRMDDRLGA